MSKPPTPTPPKKAVAYYRVSTERQGRSGLGIEAQADAVSRYAFQEGYTVIAEYTETESGRQDKRPELATALALCKKERATLIIAKLDRLGRRVSFISNLMESKVDFRAVDNPHANRFQVHILAAVAEHEREQISTRTKDALAAAKRRGVQLGQHGRDVLSKQNREAADLFAQRMRPVFKELQAAGFTTVRALCNELNNRKIATFRPNKNWQLSSVHSVLKRIKRIEC